MKHKFFKIGSLSLALLSLNFCAPNAFAIPRVGDGFTAPQLIFKHYYQEDINIFGGYRIPALTTTSQGTMIAVADKRFAGTSGNTDIFGGGRVNKVYFSYRISQDGGKSWSEEQYLRPQNLSNSSSDRWQGYISDPQIVHNPDTGSTFVFGYQSNTSLRDIGPYNVYMFRSDDGGKTWDKGTNITSSIDIQGGRWIKALQGPGGGMYYNGTLYVPIQKFTGWGGELASTSGFLYSNDNGKTWQQSSWILTDISNIQDGANPNGDYVSSESNIFHHQGFIYLAAKVESASIKDKRRMVWRTSNNGLTWERVYESFLPRNIVGCQSSSFALSDNIYFVGYTTGEDNKRQNVWLSTNTGRRVLLYSSAQQGGKESNGYSSISADLDNIYVLYEGANDSELYNDYTAAILMRKFDYAAKDYANLNARLLNHTQELFYLQESMKYQDSYIRASYGIEDQYGAELLWVKNNFKLGLFNQKSTNNGEDVSRTYAYDENNLSLLASLYNFYVGYQYSKVKYQNNAKDSVDSLLLGYGLDFNTDIIDIGFNINGILSRHNFTRNSQEGLGKEASFNSKALAMNIELSHSFDIINNQALQLRPFVGFESIYFAHDGFSEKNGNGFNDVLVDSASNSANRPYLGVEALGKYNKFTYQAKLTYKHELSNIDKWTDTYTVFDEKYNFASPVNKNDYDNFIEANVNASFNVTDNFALGLSASYDLAQKSNVFFNANYQF